MHIEDGHSSEIFHGYLVAKENPVISINTSLSILVLQISHSIRRNKRTFPAVMGLALEWKILCKDNSVFIHVNLRRGEVRVT